MGVVRGERPADEGVMTMSRAVPMTVATRLVLAALGVAVVGLLIQWVADPGKFDGANKTFGLPFPPGILFIAVFGLLSLLTRRWRWHPVFAMLIAVQIVVGGTLADKLQPNLASGDAGTVIGNVVMVVGLVGSFVAGLVAIVRGGGAGPRTAVPAREQ
jgi:hypothetical protein